MIRNVRAFKPLLIKRVLFIISILALGLSVFYVFNRQYFFEKRLPQVIISQKETEALFKKQEADYSSFLDKVRGKNIFAAGMQEEVTATDDEKETLLKKIESLSLVGVIAGDPPKVMIEDKTTSRTFYLKEGESFMEGIVVEAIGKGSVTLRAYGEKFELYL